MPRLDTFHLKLTTGARGRDTVPQYAINGFPLDFDEVSGGVGSGETLDASGAPQSFPHTLTLAGPENGPWDVAGMEITYAVNGEPPYTLRLGPVTLDEASDLNLWYKRPPKVFDV